MSLSTIIESVQKQLARDCNRPNPFAEGRARQPALTTYDTPAALVPALDFASPLSMEERTAIVAALAAEAQRAPHPLWQSLLLVTFAPMLRRLRARVGRGPNEDLDQAVLCAFLEAVRTVAPGPHTALALRWATEKRVFAGVRKERRAPETFELDEETHPADVFEIEAIDRAATAEVVRIVETLGATELMNVFLATSAGDERLKEYAARTYAGRTKKGFAAEYDRLCRARLRLVRDLRAHFRGRAAA